MYPEHDSWNGDRFGAARGAEAQMADDQPQR